MKIGYLFTLAIASATIPFSIAQESGKPGVSLTELDDRLRIELNGELFTEYRFKGDILTFPVFYPVIGPGGIPMTRNYPFKEIEGEDSDHPHHRSVWFTHSSINGINFWAVHKYRDKEPGLTVHTGFKKIESGADGGQFVATNNYVGPDGKIVCTDERSVRIHPVKTANDPRLLDFMVTVHASHGPVVFGDQKDGGMAIRVPSEMQVVRRGDQKDKSLPATGHILNSEGDIDGDTWGKRAKWVDLYGTVGGKPTGVAIFDHPKNPRHPTWWHSRTYGLCTANAFGKRFFERLEDPNAGNMEIKAGDSVTFRWRFVFHQGAADKGKLDAQFEQFAGK